ncbi:MAG: thioredoxin 1, partial [Candidatus Dependentiae bacterium]|nr:thioredoxin 1 [Candidatus Dependentiae bacterium]
AGDGCRSALQAYDFLAQAGYKPGHMGDELTMKRDLEKKEGVTTAPAIEEQTGFAVQEDAKKPGLEHSYAPGIVHEMRSTQEITALIKGSSKPVIIDFYATWCGPCRTIAPLYKKLAERYKDAAIFAKVNIDNLGGVATNYRIQGVPTFVFIKSGAEKDRIVGGGATEKQFAEKIDALI